MPKSNKYYIYYISNIIYNEQNTYSNSNLNTGSKYRRLCNKKLFNIFDMHDLYLYILMHKYLKILSHFYLIIKYSSVFICNVKCNIYLTVVNELALWISSLVTIIFRQ